ncbi:MAG TPA: hypothetical protein VKE94_03485, partial [Gemmataceae bacterium]|nr:hypothetical protein [Gemmataceae bacterium]
MRSYAAALAWEFWRRHRWGLAILVIYLAALLVFAAVMGTTDPSPARMALLASVVGTAAIPLVAAYMLVLVVFSFGSQADLASRESIYPARMLTLPVRTAALTFWPMFYGTVAAASLWLIVARFVFWPCGMELPLVWPALLAASFLAWTQVVMWMPYPLPLLRAFAAVVLLGVLLVTPQLAIQLAVPDGVIAAVLAPSLPLAYVAACVAVGRARRGDVPDWRWLLALPRRIAESRTRRKADFTSPARAQVWFEWRRHGRSLPFIVGILLPFALLLLFIADSDMPDVVLNTLAGVCFLPPFMAGFAATTVSKANPYVRDYYGVPPFTGTRPLTSAGLVAAKLEMAAWSTLAAWLLVLIATPLALTLSGQWPVITNAVQSWLAVESPLRVAVITVLIGLGLVAFTWKQLVQNLYVGLTGREWFVKLTVFVGLAILALVLPIGKWVYDHE